MRRAPKDLRHGGRCGSTAEMFGAEVDDRRHDGVTTATTGPACSQRNAGTRQRSTRRPPNPRARRDRGSRCPVATAKPQPTSAPQVADRTNHSPTQHRARQQSLAAARRRRHETVCARTTEYRLCARPPSCPEGRRAAQTRRPAHPANRIVDPGNALSGNLDFSETGERTARTATCHGARRCRHRRVIPAGQPARNETISIHTCPDSGRMPRARAHGRKTVVDPAKRSRPAAHRPSAATTQTTPSELGGLASK